MIACQLGNYDIIRRLVLEPSVDVNAVDNVRMFYLLLPLFYLEQFFSLHFISCLVLYCFAVQCIIVCLAF